MTRYEVDSAQVTAASAAVHRSAQAVATEVERMMHHLVELQSSWRGQAATSFQHVVGDWRTTQERVRGALEEIQQALSAAGQQYAQAEQDVVRLFNR